MTVNERQGVPGDLANEFFELLVVSGPFFDLGDQIHRHIDGAGFGLLLEGQVPARGPAAGPLKGAEGTFQEWAQLAQAPDGGLATGGMPIGGQSFVIHIGSIKAY